MYQKLLPFLFFITYSVYMQGRDSSSGANKNIVCGFWDTNLLRWSTEGCHTYTSDTEPQVVCSCNHLTDFSVLLVSDTRM